VQEVRKRCTQTGTVPKGQAGTRIPPQSAAFTIIGGPAQKEWLGRSWKRRGDAPDSVGNARVLVASVGKHNAIRTCHTTADKIRGGWGHSYG